jgi:transcriptional regulator with XRE-family HTH domain
MKKVAEKTNLKGIALILSLFKKAEDLGLDKYDLCEQIGITYPYLNALSNGHRPVSGVSLDKLRKMGDFLGLTFVQTQMLAEIIKPEDFVQQKGESLNNQLNDAIESMRQNTEWGSAAPTHKEWGALSLNTRIGIAMLWQSFSSKKFIETAQMILVEKNETSEAKKTEKLHKAA